MGDSRDTKCPICGGSDWQTKLNGSGFRIDECARGCIGRTIPSPAYEDLQAPSPDESMDGSYQVADLRSGHFKVARELMALVSKFKDGGRLLDIGSGLGHLLKLAQDQGYNAVGIDASPAAVRFAGEVFGVQSSVGMFPGCIPAGSSFDIVIMNHVLEHLPEPGIALQEATALLEPGGILAIAAPNYSSLVRVMRGSMWYGLQPSQHIWQMPVRSIVELIRTAGLTPVATRCNNLEYPRGPRSFVKWARLKTVLTVAEILQMGDNAAVLARK